jgi:Kef-type K+ transport system membrane component KefB
MDSTVIYILTISFVFVLSPYLSQIFRLPTAPIEIIVGSILGYFGIISVGVEESHYFDLIAEVGFLYLMFLAGLEINLKSISKMLKQYRLETILYLSILPALSFLIGHFILKLHPLVTASLPIISVGILATLSKEYGKSRWISIAFLIGVIGEVLGIATLTILEITASVGFGFELFYKLLTLARFLLIILLLYYIFHYLFRLYPKLNIVMMPHVDNRDQDMRLAMGIFFIMIAIMHILHLELAFGVFIAGLFISTFFHHKKELDAKITSFGFGFLVPIFFINVGASFDYSYFIYSIGTAVQITITMIGIRLISTIPLIKSIGKRESLLVGLSLSMPLTLLVAIASAGYHHGIITKYYYYSMILASLLEVIISMVSIKLITIGSRSKS